MVEGLNFEIVGFGTRLVGESSLILIMWFKKYLFVYEIKSWNLLYDFLLWTWSIIALLLSQ